MRPGQCLLKSWLNVGGGQLQTKGERNCQPMNWVTWVKSPLTLITYLIGCVCEVGGIISLKLTQALV